jgi:hypothetical protein
VSEPLLAGVSFPTASAEAFARAVAEDRHLAAEFAQLSAINDITGALEVVADAAADILGRCVLRPRSDDRDQPLLRSLETIQHVADASKQYGDEVQVAWCGLLRRSLLGGERPSV